LLKFLTLIMPLHVVAEKGAAPGADPRHLYRSDLNIASLFIRRVERSAAATPSAIAAKAGLDWPGGCR
jgi:hypothetical protein